MISILFCLSCGDECDDQDVSIMPIDTLYIADSIGVEMGDSNYVFGSISDFDYAPDGRILILDGIQCCIFVYSRSGEFIKRIGRTGSGPGEMQFPSMLEVLGNGTLCVKDQPFWYIYDPEGIFISSIHLGRSVPMSMISVGTEGVVGIRNRMDFLETGELQVTKRIALWNGIIPDSIETVYFEQEFLLNLEDTPNNVYRMDLFSAISTAGEDRVYVAPSPTDTPVIYCYRFDGSIADTLYLPYDEVPKSLSEIEEEKFLIELVYSQGTDMTMVWEPLPNRPMIRCMGVDSLDYLWVQRGTELSPTFDIFDNRGNLLYTAGLPDREDAYNWRFDISPGGIIAVPEDPEFYPLLYTIDQKSATH
ncbi:MAG: 6-bladed beta-propeller [Candidatus Aegiribacteria sp.]|nr:6-bladed beta-propeller [Candidatus Aegiribacteria sp.]